MGQGSSVAQPIRFGPFMVDPRSGELFNSGTKLKLRDQSFQVLVMLLESPGEVVTREQLRRKLWPQETFVDFDHGLNAAVERLRRCLGDSASKPAYIETLPRRGYRFIGTLDTTDEPPWPSEIPQAPPSSPLPNRQGLIWASAIFGALSIVLILLAIRTFQHSSGARPSPHQTMLAVLPFENLSGDANNDYLTDGLTEEIITQLGSLSPEQLGVIARSTSMAYKHTSKSALQIAGELKVDYILESSVRLDGDQMRISVQLIRAPDQVHVWAASFDRQIGHSIAMQEDVAKAIAEKIRITLSPSYTAATHSSSLDPQANEAYLRGRYFWNQFTVDGYRTAIDYFQQAIDRDPKFAEAYSGIADSYYFLVITDAMSAAEGETKAFDAARRAVALDGGLAESHSALANVLMGQYKWNEAESEFKRAIVLNPSYSPEHRIYAALLGGEKRYDEAWEQINEAMRSDPLSLPNNAEVVRTLYYRRDYDGALRQAQKALQLNPDYYRIHFWMGRVYAQKGMHREAIEESLKVLQTMPDSTVGLTEMAYSLATAGRQPEARKILDHLTAKSRSEFVPFYNLAVIHTALGENQNALEDLQKAYDEQDWALFVIAGEPRLDPLRSTTEFHALLAKLKLPD